MEARNDERPARVGGPVRESDLGENDLGVQTDSPVLHRANAVQAGAEADLEAIMEAIDRLKRIGGPNGAADSDTDYRKQA
jgi:hypothetical protein